jgi:hypothetical protein
LLYLKELFMHGNNNPEETLARWNAFSEACGSLREILKKRGAILTAPSDKARISFLQTPDCIQGIILNNLKTFLEICSETDLETKSSWDEKIFLWNFLKHFRWKLPTGTMELINDGDVIEILDGNGIQIFRSLKFFFITSYDIESFLCRHWSELFSRDESVTTQYMAYHQRCMATQTDTYYMMSDVPAHKVLELDSPGKIVGESSPVFCGPIFPATNSDRAEAVIHVFKPTFISSVGRTKPQPNQSLSLVDNVQ